MSLDSLDWKVSDVRLAKLAMKPVRVKPEPELAARNQSGRIENKQARAMRRGT